MVECGPEDRERLQQTVFDYFRLVNTLELKGPDDPLTVKDYNKVMMRAWAIGEKEPRVLEDPSSEAPDPEDRWALPGNRTATAVCVVRPDRILEDPSYRFAPTAEPGIYLYDGQFPVRIIVPAELPFEERYYPLLPLARGRKLQEFIELCIQRGWWGYLQLALDVGLAADPEADWTQVRRVLTMQAESTEELSALIGEVIELALSRPDRYPGVVRRVAEIKRSGEAAGRQGALLQQLRLKFGAVPAAVEQQIQETTDPAILDGWLERVLRAETLEQMGFAA